LTLKFDLEEIQSDPKVVEILENPDITTRDKRRRIADYLGIRKTRKVYKSEAERKKAAKDRAVKRTKERTSFFAGLGIAPAKRETLSPAEKKERSKARRKRRTQGRRDLMREIQKTNPDLLKKYKIDVSKFKL